MAFLPGTSLRQLILGCGLVILFAPLKGIAAFDGWSGYVTHSVTTEPGSDLTDFTFIVSLNQFPSEFWTAVQTDCDDIRASKDAAGATELPVDIIECTDNGSTGAGLIAVKFSGTKASTSNEPIYIWAGNASATRPAAGDTYGQYAAYASHVRAFYPNGGGNDRTTNANNLTMTGSPTVGGNAGPINGSLATDYNGSTQYGTATASVPTATPVSMLGWANPDNVTAFMSTLSIADSNLTGVDFQTHALQLRGDVASDPVRARTTAGAAQGAGDKTSFLATSWQQVGAVFASATSRTGYLNGVGGTTDTTSATPAGIDLISLGATVRSDAARSFFMDGKLSLFSLHNAALSADWLSYHKEMLDDADQSDFYGAWSWTEQDVTAPTVQTLSPADEATNVSITSNLVLTFDETTRVGTGSVSIKRTSDNVTVEQITVSGSQLSGNSSTQLTLNPAVTLSGSTSYYVTWTANTFKDASANHVAAQTSTTYWNFTTASALTSNLVGHWKFDDGTGTSATDSSGNGYTGTLTNGPTWSTGKIGPYALTFDGTNDFVDIGTSINAVTAGSFSASLWFKWGTSGVATGLIDNGFGTTGGFQISTLTTNNLRARIDDAGGTHGGTLDTASTINDGNWHNIVFVADKGAAKIAKMYLDGMANGATLDLTNYGDTTGTLNPDTIGVLNAIFRFNGNIDDVRIYDRALSALDVAELADIAAPVVQTLSPADNATNVSVTSNLALTFDEVTRAGTGSLSIKRTSDNVTVEQITVSGSQLSGNGTTQLTLNPAVTLSGSTSYYVTWTANAFKDTYGNHIAAQTSTTYWNFTTADVTAPTISSLSPTDDATGVAIATDLVITFDEVIQGGTGSVVIRKGSDNSTVETIVANGGLVTGSGSTIIIVNPSVTLTEGTAYYVQIQPTAFRDTSGNFFAGISDTTTWNFETVAAPVASSSSPSTTAGGGGGGRGSPAVMAKRIADAQDHILALYQNRLRALEVAQDASSSQHSSAASSRSSDRPPRQVAQQSKPSLATIQELGARRGVLVATVDQHEVLYRDVPTDAWFAPYVAAVIEEQIAEGYRDEDGKPTGEFGVGNPITRAEVLKMAFEAAGISVTGLPPPRNITAKGTWAEAYIAAAEVRGILSPQIDVNAPATRGEVVDFILQVLGQAIAKQPAPFQDVPIEHPHASAIATAAFFGLVQGDTAADGSSLGTFRPDDTINRAEVAKLIALAHELLK